MWASLTALDLPLSVLVPTFITLWESCTSLLVDQMRSIEILLEESRYALKRPWLYNYIIKGIPAYLKGTMIQIGTFYKMVPKWPIAIYLALLEVLFLENKETNNIDSVHYGIWNDSTR